MVRQLLPGSADKTVRLWDTRTGSLRHTLTGHTDSVKVLPLDQMEEYLPVLVMTKLFDYGMQ